jgi:hypothetical protein
LVSACPAAGEDNGMDRLLKTRGCELASYEGACFLFPESQCKKNKIKKMSAFCFWKPTKKHQVFKMPFGIKEHPPLKILCVVVHVQWW